jgi:hypothetical protein
MKTGLTENLKSYAYAQGADLCGIDWAADLLPDVRFYENLRSLRVPHQGKRRNDARYGGVHLAHERLPADQLRDGEILLEAKIIGIADVVEAIASHRPYRSAQGIDKGARGNFQACRGAVRPAGGRRMPHHLSWRRNSFWNGMSLTKDMWIVRYERFKKREEH